MLQFKYRVKNKLTKEVTPCHPVFAKSLPEAKKLIFETWGRMNELVEITLK